VYNHCLVDGAEDRMELKIICLESVRDVKVGSALLPGACVSVINCFVFGSTLTPCTLLCCRVAVHF
jgi:hypothetical protein